MPVIDQNLFDRSVHYRVCSARLEMFEQGYDYIDTDAV